MSREEARHTYTYYFNGEENKGHWLISGIKISEKSFDDMFPKQEAIIPQRENCDRTKAWLSNRKSY